MSTDVLVAFISGLAGPLAVTIANGIINRKAKRDADAGADSEGDVSDPDTLAGVVVRWANDLARDVERVQSRLAELEAEVETLRAENALLRRHNELLSGQVRQLGGVPFKMPGSQ